MRAPGSRPAYLSYLLRLWRTGDRETNSWRGSLEDAHTGERQGFASLEALMAYLRVVMAGEGQDRADEAGGTAGGRKTRS